ncbi:MAG: glycosyltransferase family 4 protein [Gemmatimonadaceae bacterium]
MKVLFLTHSFPRFSGDAPGSFLLRLAIALRDEDVRVHVVAPAADGIPTEDDIDGISVARFRYAPRKYEKLAYTGTMAQDVATSWSARLALVGFFGSDFVRAVGARRSFNPDLIHSHWWFPSGVVGTWLSSLSHRPLVTTLHGTDVRLAKKIGMSRPLFRRVVNQSAKVTTVSNWLSSEVASLISVPRPSVAPMPVDTERFVPGAFREKQRFLFAGRLNRQKGLEHLIRALAKMRQHALLDVVGAGPLESTLRSLAAELGVADRIAWMGQLKQSDLVHLYQSATALVVPSTDEGLGLVAAEALLCETPVVAFRSGGLTDVVQDGMTGILVTPGDPMDLAKALDRVLDNPTEAGDFGRAGRMFALSAFAPESAARQYAGIYKQVLAEHPA